MTRKIVVNISFLSRRNSVFWLLLSLILVACNTTSTNPTATKTWYAEANLSTQTPTTIQATGKVPISNLAISNTSGAIYRPDFNTWSLSNTADTGSGISFTFNLSQINGLQLRLKTAAAIVNGVPNCPLWITVNGTKIFNEAFTDKNDQWHQVNWNISADNLQVGTNTISIYLDSSASTQYFIKSAVINPALHSYYEVDFSTDSYPTKIGYGSTPISNFSYSATNSSKITFNASSKAIELVPGAQTPPIIPGTLAFDLTLDKHEATMVQLALQLNGTYSNECEMAIRLGTPTFSTSISSIQSCDGTNPQVLFQIPQDYLATGTTNGILVSANASSGPILISNAYVLPQKIYAKKGLLNTTIYAQFGETDAISGVKGYGPSQKNIWTRGYGLKKDIMMIPAPTFHYKPGDILNVNLINKLNPESNHALKAFEAGEAANLGAGSPVSADEVLDNVNDKIRHEVNIPHNLNNTNLHVHGLHVDPSKDDVTIVIVPEGESNRNYDAPHLQNPTAHGLDEGSVSDQSVKGGGWDYQYKIYENHLPGTHWYHPHKHGSTAAQLENGMAGSMIIEDVDCSVTNPNVLPVIPCPNESIYSTPLPAGVTTPVSQTNYKVKKWTEKNDRIFMIQEITNYGIQQGGANGGGNATQTITINGINKPNGRALGMNLKAYQLDSGQTQRWRFINAGTNHKAFAQIWLGKKTLAKDANSNPIYASVKMYLVATDGVTLDEKVEVTPSHPLLMGPGNRSDVLIQLSNTTSDAPGYVSKSSAEFTLFKYYPTDMSISSSDKGANTTADLLTCATLIVGKKETKACTGKLSTIATAPLNNPYLLTRDFTGFTKNWQVGEVTPTVGNPVPTVPLLKVTPATKQGANGNNNNLIKVHFALKGEFPSTSAWQPLKGPKGGGSITPTELFSITVSNNPVSTIQPLLPGKGYLKGASAGPNGKLGTHLPSYVAKITDEKIVQSRPVTFDRSGAAVTVKGDGDGSEGSITVRQFTLNGRPFALNDMIGNNTPAVKKRLKTGVTNKNHDTDDTIGIKQVNVKEGSGEQPTDLKIQETLSLTEVGDLAGYWSNSVKKQIEPAPAAKTDVYYWANPSYFQAINTTTGPAPAHAKTYSFAASVTAVPTWSDISGISTPSIVNQNASINDIKVPNINFPNIPGVTPATPTVPGLPVATTAEEWILINNSDIGHPFHIHINPFFVVEVGQLSFETFQDSTQEWVLRASRADSVGTPLADLPSTAPSKPTAYKGDSKIATFVNKWWDTVIVPPHGYVKVRYWMNVPDQIDFGINASVTDDANKEGIWVYHCHILRHEDRGMMMPVITQKFIPSP